VLVAGAGEIRVPAGGLGRGRRTGWPGGGGCGGAGGLASGEAERDQQELRQLQDEEDRLQQAAIGVDAEPVAAGQRKIENGQCRDWRER
jgi:hypothetical protein